MGTSSWPSVEGVLGLLLIVLLFLFVVGGWRAGGSPWPARLLGAATVSAAVVAGVRLGDVIGRSPDWGAEHLWGAVLLVGVLVAAAYQWPTAWFRGLAALVALGVATAVTGIGLSALTSSELGADRAKVTDLDRALARLEPSEGVDTALSALLAAVELQYDKVVADTSSTASARDALANLHEAVEQVRPRDVLAHGPHGQAYTGTLASLTTAFASVEGPPFALSTAYRAAIASLQDGADAWSLRNEAQDQLTAACTASGGRFVRGEISAARSDVCGDPVAEMPAVEPGDAAAAVARADLAVANAAAGTGLATEAELSAVSDADRALADALASSSHDRPAHDLAAAATAGLEGLLNLPSQPLLPTLGLWAAVVIALVLCYRSLEILNSGVDPVPVRLDGEFKVGEEDLKSAFKHHLMTNLPEPGAQPQSGVRASITDLLSTDVVTSSAVTFAMKVLNAVGFPQRGYVVTASALPGQAAGASSATGTPPRVTLVIKAERSLRPIHVVTAHGETAQAAVENAAYQVVSWILCRSRGVPPWLQWKTTEAQAFAKRAVIASTANEDTDNKPTVETWRELVALAPGSAQLRVSLGQALDLEGKYHDALEQYTIAARMWPDYTIARYREAIAATNVAHESAEGATAARDVRELQATAVGSYRSVKVASFVLILGLRKLSLRERRQAGPMRDWLAQYRAVALAARTSRARFATRDKAATGKKRGLADGEWVKRVDHSRSALMLYNAACAILSRAELPGDSTSLSPAAKRASLVLRRLPSCPDIGRVSADWLDKDPDLRLPEDVSTKEAKEATVEIDKARSWVLSQIQPPRKPL